MQPAHAGLDFILRVAPFVGRALIMTAHGFQAAIKSVLFGLDD